MVTRSHAARSPAADETQEARARYVIFCDVSEWRNFARYFGAEQQSWRVQHEHGTARSIGYNRSPFEDSEFWDPKVRLPLCLNAPAAKSRLLLSFKTADLALQGESKTQMFDGIKVAFAKKELPLPLPGSMCHTMSKQQYFGPKDGNADPHLVFWFAQKDHMDWGAERPNSPVDVQQYSAQPLSEFAISVSKWSDGSAAPARQQM
jgi:hypothetical protein